LLDRDQYTSGYIPVHSWIYNSTQLHIYQYTAAYIPVHNLVGTSTMGPLSICPSNKFCEMSPFTIYKRSKLRIVSPVAAWGQSLPGIMVTGLTCYDRQNTIPTFGFSYSSMCGNEDHANLFLSRGMMVVVYIHH